MHSFWHTHPRCGLWLSQLSGGVLWSIGVGGFCFLLLCQVPSQRLLISVNLSCATTFSFPLPLSLSPISLTFPLSLSTSPSLCLAPIWLIHIAFIAEYLHQKPLLITLSSLLLRPASFRLPLTLTVGHLISRQHCALRAVCHIRGINNKQVCFHSTLMTMTKDKKETKKKKRLQS